MLTPRKIARYGWRPDLPDQRDFVYAAPRQILRALPTKVDLRIPTVGERSRTMPPVYDQGELGSCTANAIGGAFEFTLRKQNARADFMPSRLFIYYNERVVEHSVASDAGAMLRDGVKVVQKLGACPEKEWPYEIQRFAEKPAAKCFSDALKHQVLSYHRVARDLKTMKACLAEGFPFVFGFSVYESFESAAVAKSGKVNIPKANEKLLGGHAVLAIGFEDKSKRFFVRNSWGATWGQKGYFTMPYDYLLNANLSDDFWTIRVVE